MVTMKNVADKAGVSKTTVSRVLSGKASEYGITKATEEKVREIARKLNYVPNQLAKGLRLKQTKSIGLVVPDISNPFFSCIVKNISKEAHKLGYSLSLSDSQDDTNIESNTLSYLQNRVVDGFIVCPVGQKFDHIQDLINDGEKVVVVDRYFPELDCPSIISDNYKGAVEGTEFLINNGHKTIGFIQGELNTSVNDDRLQGYKDTLKKYDIPISESLIVGDSFGERNGYISTKLLLNREPEISAIFATSNLISHGSLRAMSEDGLKIPEDISIISFDDQPYSDLLKTPMTTVTQQKEEIGRLAFKLLIEQIKTNKINKTQLVKIPTKLVERKSVRKIN